MAITMYLNDDPSGSRGAAIFMTALGLVFGLLALYAYRPLIKAPRG